MSVIFPSHMRRLKSMSKVFTSSDELPVQVQQNPIAALVVINLFRWQLRIPWPGSSTMLNHDDIGIRHVGIREMYDVRIPSERAMLRGIDY